MSAFSEAVRSLVENTTWTSSRENVCAIFPSPLQGLARGDSHPGFRFAPPWATILRRFAACATLHHCRQHFFCTGDAYSVIPAIYANRSFRMSAFSEAVRSLVENTTWTSSRENVCAIFPSPLQGLARGDSHPGFRFAPPWATILRRFAACATLHHCRQHFFCTGDAYSGIPAIYANRSFRMSAFSEAVRSLVENTTWTSSRENVCAIFPSPLQGLARGDSHPGFRFAPPWATILRRFAACATLHHCRQHFFCTGDAYSVIPPIYANRSFRMSAFSEAVRSLVENTTWTSSRENVCAIFPSPLQGLAGRLTLPRVPLRSTLGYDPAPLRGFGRIASYGRKDFFGTSFLRPFGAWRAG